MQYIEGINRKSKIAFPEYIDDYIEEDNPVRVIDVFVESLDMDELGFKNSKPKDKGRPPYNPKDLLKLYIYGYMNKITSSRKLEKATKTNIEVMWLLRRLTPYNKSISDFRKDNKDAINTVFKEFVALCKGWDLFGKEIVAVDGSKFRASNSKKNNFNAKSLDRKIEYLEEKVEKYMQEIEENDIEESIDREPSKEEIKSRIKELEERKEKYERYKEKIEKGETTEISTTDPDTRLMATNNNGINVCYNVQTVVDSKHKLIVDCDVINNPTDHGMLSKMAKSAKETFEVEELKALADKGYYNVDDLIECEKENIITYVSKQAFSNATGEAEFYIDKFKYDKEQNVYICPKGQKLYSRRQKPIDENTKEIVYRNFEACGKCEFKDKCTKDKKGRRIRRSIHQDFLDKVDKRTTENKELYKQRQMIVEHPFGTVKRAINILGIKEIMRRLKAKRVYLTSSLPKYAMQFGNIILYAA